MIKPRADIDAPGYRIVIFDFPITPALNHWINVLVLHWLDGGGNILNNTLLCQKCNPGRTHLNDICALAFGRMKNFFQGAVMPANELYIDRKSARLARNAAGPVKPGLKSGYLFDDSPVGQQHLHGASIVHAAYFNAGIGVLFSELVNFGRRRRLVLDSFPSHHPDIDFGVLTVRTVRTVRTAVTGPSRPGKPRLQPQDGQVSTRRLPD